MCVCVRARARARARARERVCVCVCVCGVCVRERARVCVNWKTSMHNVLSEIFCYKCTVITYIIYWEKFYRSRFFLVSSAFFFRYNFHNMLLLIIYFNPSLHLSDASQLKSGYYARTTYTFIRILMIK